MKTTKTLMLAAIAALTLGAGSAMADGSGGSFPDYQSSLVQRAAQKAAVQGANSQVQSGSSDINMEQPGTATFILKHNLAGAGGFSG